MRARLESTWRSGKWVEAVAFIAARRRHLAVAALRGSGPTHRHVPRRSRNPITHRARFPGLGERRCRSGRDLP